MCARVVPLLSLHPELGPLITNTQAGSALSKSGAWEHFLKSCCVFAYIALHNLSPRCDSSPTRTSLDPTRSNLEQKIFRGGKMRTIGALIVLILGMFCCVTTLRAAERAAAASATTILFRTPTGGNVPDAGAWVTVLETHIAPPGGKDLFIGFTAESEIINVNNNAATGSLTASAALGELLVRVLVDNKPATPGIVVFNALQHVVTTKL